MTSSDPAARPEGSETSPTGLIVVEAVRVDSRRILLVLTGLWLVAAIVLAACWSWLDSHGHRAWLWTAVDGTVLGLLGLVLAGRHRDAGRTD